MYETIVVPLDGSEQAELALPYAEEISGRIGSRIILLSILESAETREYHEHQVYIERIVERTKHGAERYLDMAGKAIKVGSATRVGYPAEGIVDYAGRGGFKLIIMSTHGRSGVRRWVFGSVADKVLHEGDKPLLLVRAPGAKTE